MTTHTQEDSKIFVPKINDSDLKTFKDKIAELDLKKKLVAKQLGITNATLSRILSGVQPYISEILADKIKNFFTDEKLQKLSN